MADRPAISGQAGGNLAPLSLHVPEPPYRPGDPASVIRTAKQANPSFAVRTIRELMEKKS